MDDGPGGWTVIQRRQPSCLPADLFYKNWFEYKEGFGDLRSEFWLGLDAFHSLTEEEEEELEMKLTLSDFDGNTTVFILKDFSVGDEDNMYAVDFAKITRDGEKVHTSHFANKNQKFSTPDRDNDHMYVTLKFL